MLSPLWRIVTDFHHIMKGYLRLTRCQVFSVQYTVNVLDTWTDVAGLGGKKLSDFSSCFVRHQYIH